MSNSKPLLVVALPGEVDWVQMPSNLDTLITGMGPINATHELTRHLMCARPSFILNVGTSGSVNPDYNSGVYAIEQVSSFHHPPPGNLLNEHAPINLPTSFMFRPCKCSSAAHFVEDIPKEVHLVDMELYSLAWVAAKFAVPLYSLKVVSDGGDVDSFAEGVAEARAKLTKAALAELKTLGFG